MCRSWKREKCNHHFPELSKNRKIVVWLSKFVSWRTASVSLAVLTVGIGFVYLLQTNVSATKGYAIEKLNEKIANLEEENKKLNLRYIETQSMANIVSQVGSMDLVATTEIDTVSSLGSAVALR